MNYGQTHGQIEMPFNMGLTLAKVALSDGVRCPSKLGVLCPLLQVKLKQLMSFCKAVSLYKCSDLQMTWEVTEHLKI